MRLLTILFLGVLFFRLNASNQNSVIPEQDLQKINYLFEYLIQEHDFAYTLFGTKPMALADICLWLPQVPTHRYCHAKMLLLKKRESLNAWYKHKKSFKLNNFIILDEEKDLFDCLVFAIINKSQMISLLQMHEPIFKEILGNSFTPEGFLEQLENKSISLAQAIQHHYGLLGILLGYGVRNSMLYQERYLLLQQRDQELFENSNLNEKIRHIESQLQPFNEFKDLVCINPLCFGADLNHPETIELKKKYDADLQKIIELMHAPNFMECVFNKLVE